MAEDLDQTQREMLLRRQLAAIRKELGEDGDASEDWATRIAEADMPEAARTEAERELGRLERQPDGAEAGMIRTYLEWMLSLPWNKRSEEHLDVAAAREVLDADHAGLDEVKERILEYLAVRRLRREREMDEGRSGVILTLVGPPGTGKTSLGESIARALGREFSRISLGGIRDEAEIRGHRRTYVGALPGRLVRALREAGTRQPGDHARRGRQGRRRLARRPLLGPARGARPRPEPQLPRPLPRRRARPLGGPVHRHRQRGRHDPGGRCSTGWRSSRSTATPRTRSSPSRSGYLVPRQTERNGLHEGEVEVTEDAVRSVIGDYTREAGVRNLERELGKVLRKAARRVAEGSRGHRSRSAPTTCRTPSGARASTTRRPSARRRRAWPPGWRSPAAGGDVLFVEASAMPADGPGERLVLTGQLGDVMRESARIALS